MTGRHTQFSAVVFFIILMHVLTKEKDDDYDVKTRFMRN